MKDEDVNLDVILRHVVDGRYTFDELVPGLVLETIRPSENTITITKVNGKKFVNGARIVRENIAGTNGVIHTINEVLV